MNDKLFSPEYLAGLFDGEGCISALIKRGRTRPSLRLSIAQNNLGFLRLLQSELGMGNISSRGRELVIYNEADLRGFISLIHPYSIIKRRQLSIAWRILNDRSRVHLVRELREAKVYHGEEK